MQMSAWPEIISELLVNLAAGWIGVVVAVPAIIPLQTMAGLVFLTANLLLGIVSLLMAKRLRELKVEI